MCGRCHFLKHAPSDRREDSQTATQDDQQDSRPRRLIHHDQGQKGEAAHGAGHAITLIRRLTLQALMTVSATRHAEQSYSEHGPQIADFHRAKIQQFSGEYRETAW